MQFNSGPCMVLVFILNKFNTILDKNSMIYSKFSKIDVY